jgi:hypothetical protein
MRHLFPITIRGGCLAVCLFFTSCAVLTDSQIQNINGFAATTKAYCAYPSAVVKHYADLHLTLELMDASELRFQGPITDQLTLARSTYGKIIQSSGAFDVSLQLIQKYGTLLITLSSDHFANDLSGPAESLGGNLDSAISLFDAKTGSHLSVGLGSAVSELILFAGKRLTKRKQTMALKQFVLEMDPIVTAATRALESVMNNEMATLSREDSSRFANDARKMMAQLLLKDTVRGLNWERYQADRAYYDQLTAYIDADAFRKQVAQAAVSLREAHAALAKNVQEKRDLKGFIGETQKFITDVQPLGPALSKYMGPVFSNYIKLP